MRTNRIKEQWLNGQVAINGWLTIPSSWTAELLAHSGADCITIDMQHGLIDYSTAINMLQAISTTETVPFVRVPWNEAGILMRMLDAGAYGIICPMVNNRKEAEALVSACRYSPNGMRSYGPARATLYAGDDYLDHADNTILLLAMIETAEALENVDEIISTNGLDGVYLGPADLSKSLGLKEIGNYHQPEMQTAVDKILQAAHKHHRFAAAHAITPQDAVMLAKRGFNMVTCFHDTSLLRVGAKQALSQTYAGLMN